MGFWFTVFLWAATFVISDYFRQRLPRVEPSGVGDFTFPTATQGRKVPVCPGGTPRIDAPNVLWHGDWDAEAITVETGIIFRRDETVGYRYRVSAALGQFQGECVGMTGIWIGDDKVFDYATDAAGVPQTVVDVNLPQLFGGERMGGGFQARFRCFTGEDAQPVSSYLAARITNQSRWPGFTYVVMTSTDEVLDILGITIPFTGAETRGAVIGESNQLREIRIEFQTFDDVAGSAGKPSLGDELSLGNDHHFIGRDANPISAAYRIMTDPDFTLNLSNINLSNFQAVAEICYTEGLGYTQLIDSEIEAFEILAEIEKHVDGYIGLNPISGLFEITLARAGYDPQTEFQATVANIREVRDYSAPDWIQTKNDVRVQFADRAQDYEDNYAGAQDLANRLITNRPSPITLRFPGVREAAVANQICARVSRAYFWPLGKGQLIMDRTAYDKRPGDVVVVTHPDFGNAVSLPTRVSRVSTGDPVDQTIVLDVVEDVFRFESGIQADPPPGDFVPPSPDPVAVSPFAATLAPRWLLADNAVPLEPRILYLAGRNPPNSAAVIQWQRRAVFGAGGYQSAVLERIPQFVIAGTLRSALGQLTDSANDGGAAAGQGADFQIDGAVGSLVGTYDPLQSPNLVAMINPGTTTEEVVSITQLAPDALGAECTGVIRGIGDTAINAHAAGEPIFFLDGAYVSENQGLVDGQGLRYKIAGFASQVTEDFAGLAFQPEIEIDDRALKPLPPAGIRNPNLSASALFPAGPWPADGPVGPIGSPTAQGLLLDILNRRFDQVDQVQAANNRADGGGNYANDAFSDYLPSINYYFYDLAATPSPSRADAIASGQITTDTTSTPQPLIDGDEEVLINVSVFRGLGVASGSNLRLELTLENQNAVIDVPAAAESRSLFIDRVITWTPGFLDFGSVAQSILILHGDEVDGATQFIDHSPNNFTVTAVGGAEVDTQIASPTGLDGSLSIGRGSDYLEIGDSDEFMLNLTTGFSLHLRIQFVSGAPSSGTLPIITQWRESDNQRAFYFGFSNDDFLFSYSSTGTNVFSEVDDDAWANGVWYDIGIVVLGSRVWYLKDGMVVGTDTIAVNAMHNSSAPIRIGADGDGNVASADIRIAEFRLMNTAPLFSTYTIPTQQFPGREQSKPLHVQWDRGADEDKSYQTEDLNRYPVSFPSGPSTNTKIDSAQSKFGGLSLFCGGYTDLTIDSNPENADGVWLENTAPGQSFGSRFDMGIEDFTIECFVRFAALPSTTAEGMALLSRYYRVSSAPWGDLFLVVDESNTLQFFYTTASNVTFSVVYDWSGTIAINTWYHVAAVRENGVVSLFVEGNRVAQNTTDFVRLNMVNASHSGLLAIGRYYRPLDAQSGARGRALNGWIDEIRIQRGVAEYSGATYIVPTAAFTVDPAPVAPPPVIVTGPSNWQPTNLR